MPPMAFTQDRQFLEAIERSRHALLTFRSAWTADAVTSALALKRILEKRGKKADIVAENFNAPAALAFLPGIAEIKPRFHQLRRFTIELDISKIAVDELAYDHDGEKLRIHVAPKSGMYAPEHVTTAPGAFKYDLVVTLDTPDYASLGGLYRDHTELFFAQPTVNIDHDPANEHYGNINLVDLTATLKRDADVEGLRAAFARAAAGRWKGLVDLAHAQAVSCDFTGRTESVILDLDLTLALGPRFVKVVGWHDNETGYAARLCELVSDLAERT